MMADKSPSPVKVSKVVSQAAPQAPPSQQVKQSYSAVPNLHSKPLELEEVDVDWDDD
jgi:hypothetical protein